MVGGTLRKVGLTPAPAATHPLSSLVWMSPKSAAQLAFMGPCGR